MNGGFDRLSIAIGATGSIVRVGEDLASYFECSIDAVVHDSLEKHVRFRERSSGELVYDCLRIFDDRHSTRQQSDLVACFASGQRLVLRDVTIDEPNSGDRLTILRLDSPPSVGAQWAEEAELLVETARLAQVGGWSLERGSNQIRWTDQTFRLHDLEPGDAPDMGEALSFYDVEDQFIVSSAIERAFAKGEPYDLELKVTTAKGCVRFTRSICRPVIEDGTVVRLHGTFQDITVQHKSQQKLLESEDRYRSVFEDSGAIKLLVDPLTRRIVEANSAALKFYGYSANKLTSMTITDLNMADGATVDNCMAAAQDKRILEFEFRHRLASGEMRDVKVYSGPVCIDQKTLLHSIIFDITEQKRAQESVVQMQQLESLGTLAGGIAHDFNNVLTAVSGNIMCAAEMLSETHPATSSLQNAQYAVDRARTLSQKLLTFAKGGEPICETVGLSELVSEVVRFDLSGSNVKAEFHFASDLSDVYVDRAQLQQVFSNLSINAVQAMPDGGLLKITASNATDKSCNATDLPAGNYVKVTMEDSGVGVRTDDLGKIFTPYFTTKSTGHGLGLATCYSIVKKNSGCIDVESVRGKWTRFTIHLPASSNEPVAQESPMNVAPVGLPEGLRVLVLDDEQIILDVISTSLGRDGTRVSTCQNTTDALATFTLAVEAKDAFDVAILDLTIPGEPGGKEAIKQLRSIDPNILAICSTGYADDPVIANFAEYGFDGALAKPYRPQQLKAAIVAVLSNAKR